ncbi:hypothetical protein MMC12_007534 [Toensbergia leucococca]|nr:hypothetical protein [Toensbergia leucococca]
MFNLGLSAVAAAAHRHEFSPPHKTDVDQSRFSPAFLTSLLSMNTAVTRSIPGPATAPLSQDSAIAPIEDTDLDRQDCESLSTITSNPGTVTLIDKRTSVSKSKTTFQLAHPPPTTIHRQRFKLRPRVLLQIQRISDTSRHTPVLDVLPSITFAPTLARRCPWIFKGRAGLGSDDLIIAGSQAYDTPAVVDDETRRTSQDGQLDYRGVVAAICQLGPDEAGLPGRTEICMSHGPSWAASSLPNGAYEFLAIDGEGHRTTARWVPKSVRRNTQDRSTSAVSEEKKFNFSIINPDTRRHPVIASLSSRCMDISDRYSMPSHSVPPLNPPIQGDNASLPCQHVHFNERDSVVVEMDDFLRTLIIVTGIWIAFREGWSQSFRYNNSKSSPSIPKTTRQSQKNRESEAVSRSGTSTIESNFQANEPLLNNGFKQRSSTSIIPTDIPQRTRSVGAAFLQRVNSRKKILTRESMIQYSAISPAVSESGEKLNGHRRSKSLSQNETSQKGPTLSKRQTTNREDNRSSRTLSNGSSETYPTVAGSQIPKSRGGNLEETKRKSRRLTRLFNFMRRTATTH